MINEESYNFGSTGSVIRELGEYGQARAAVVGEENVFNFTIGNPSLPPPQQIRDTMEALCHADPLQLHSYTPAPGLLQARQAIAEDLNRRFDAGARAEDLFLCCGTSPELAAVFRALTVPKAEILVLAPYFPEYRPFVEGAGATLKVVPPDVPDFQINMAALEAALTENTVAVIVNSPNNPAGTVYTRQTLQQLSQLLQRKAAQYAHPIYIVADEPYRELAYGVEVPFIPNIYPDTVVCYSYSKSLSLPGERIGYIYVPQQAADSRRLYAAIAGAARTMGHICAPSLWQQVIAQCAHLQPELDAYDRNRRALYEGLTDAGYEVARPDGAFYLFVRAPGYTGAQFCQKAKALDVLVVPGDDFGCPDYFRLCYCVSYEKLLRSLPLFRKLLEK